MVNPEYTLSISPVNGPGAGAGRPVQLELAIDHAPAKVRAHGLRDAHSRPLVSRGKRTSGAFGPSFRVSPSVAWSFPSIELRAGNSWPVLILDCDGDGAGETIAGAMQNGAIPWPNWVVTRTTSGGSHVVYTLAAPVHRGARARARPLAALARVSEYLAMVLAADRGYGAVLSHNPMARGQRGTALRTTWGRAAPYTLGELGAFVPTGWRKPVVARTAIGRNCALFDALMRFAGRPRNAAAPLAPAAAVANSEFPYPLSETEVRGIVKSVERYRAEWIERDRYYTAEERRIWGAKGGAKGGAARRKATAAKTAAVVADVGAGMGIKAAARKHGLSPPGVRYLIRREAPLLAPGGGGK